MTRYHTIVADPPWHYDHVPATRPSGKDKRVLPGPLLHEPLGYLTLSVAEITALPVRELADADARLFLWTTNRYLPAAFMVAAAWDFTYRQMLVWHKAEGGPFIASVAPNTAEYLLVATRGQPARTGRIDSSVLKIRAPREHSRKPDVFIDLIEQVSPGPYLEMFARRARFGWDYYGDQSLGTAVMPERAA
jgi:N6-adenosine-specific RNA methylase IME4